MEDKTGTISADAYLSQKTEPMRSHDQLSKAPRKIFIPVCPHYMAEIMDDCLPLYGRTKGYAYLSYWTGDSAAAPLEAGLPGASL
jgi:hypothetical protein